MKCPKCKHVIPDDSLFCPDCGCKIDNKEERIKELKCEAKAAYDAEDYGKSFGAYYEAANLGDADAQYILAMQYENGQGTIQDGKAYHKWLLKAAQNGHVEAQFLVAEQYYNGEHIKKDKKTAAVWYQKAANAKHPDAMFKLGYCYEMGEGVPQNDSLAQEYFVQAEKLGSKMYADYLDEKEEEDRRQEKIRKEKEEEERRTAEQEKEREFIYGYHNVLIGIAEPLWGASFFLSFLLAIFLSINDSSDSSFVRKILDFVLILSSGGVLIRLVMMVILTPYFIYFRKKWRREHDPENKYKQINLDLWVWG